MIAVAKLNAKPKKTNQTSFSSCPIVKNELDRTCQELQEGAEPGSRISKKPSLSQLNKSLILIILFYFILILFYFLSLNFGILLKSIY